MSTAPNGDFFLAAHYRSSTVAGIQVIHFDEQGEMIWAKVVSYPTAETSLTARGMTVTADGGVVVVGGRSSAVEGDSACVVKLDGNGDLLWSKRFCTSSTDPWCSAYDVAEAPNGDLLVGGEVADNTQMGNNHINLFLARISATGTALWTKQISPQIAGTFDRFGGIVLPVGGGIAVAGMTGYSESWIMFFTDAGAISWAMKYDLGSQPLGLLTSPSGYEVFYPGELGGLNVLYRIATDATGSITDSQSYTVTGNVDGNAEDIIAMPDGSRAVVGAVTIASGTKVCLFKLDAGGVAQGGMAYGGDEGAAGWALTSAVDGGFIMAGQYSWPIQSPLIKTNASGNSFYCEEPITVNSANTTFTSSAYGQNVTDTLGWADGPVVLSVEYTQMDACFDQSIQSYESGIVQLFPNPVSALVTVIVNAPGVWTHEVVDATGRVLLDAGIIANIDVSHLADGRYIVRSTDGYAAAYAPLIVVH